MSFSQFDGNSAFSGGGFMPSQATQSTDISPSVSKIRNSQGLFPLTVKQMSQAYDSSDDKSGFVVDGADVNNITVVGMVSNKVERATDVTFTVDDGTGQIECHRWNEVIESREMEQIQEGMYVRVHGHLKGFQGRKQLVVFSVRPVTNFNEIAFHFIECVYVHVYNTKHQKVQGGQAQPNVANSAMGSNGSVGHPVLATNQASVQNRSDGTTSLDEMVLALLKHPALDQGVGMHVDQLAKQLNVPKATLMASIKSLENEGTAYQTVDEFHYKST